MEELTPSESAVTAAPPARARLDRRWFGVLALLVIVLISYVDRVNVSVLVTDRAFTDHFGMTDDRALQGALMTAFLVGYGVAAFLLTPVYESVLGVRRGLLVSVVSWALFTVVSPYALGALLLVGLRFLLGAAEGPLFSLKTMYIKERFAPDEVGKPNAVSSMGVSLGTAVGMPLVTFLVYRLDWHASFLTLALLNAAVGLPLILLFVRERSRTAAQAAAHEGESTLVEPEAAKSRRSWQTVRAALRTPRLGWIVVIEICTLAYLWGSSSWLPSYLLDERHFSLAAMGAVSSLPFLLSLASGFLGGWLIDRLHVARAPVLFVVGSIGTGVSVLLVISSDAAWLAALGLILANGFWGLQGPAIPTLVQHHSARETVGTTYGVVNGAGNLVSAFMPTAMGVAISLTGGFSAGYGLLIGTQVVTLLCSLYLLARPGGRVRPVDVAPPRDGARETAVGAE